MLILLYLLLTFGLQASATFTTSPEVKSRIKIDRIDDYEDLYTAAKLSIDVFFRDSESEQSQRDSNIFGFFQKNNRESMYQELFRNHLNELNSRLSKPNCVLLKAIDADSKEILGFVEMFMAACVVENNCDKLPACDIESEDGEVYPKELTTEYLNRNRDNDDDNSEREAVADDVLKAQSWMSNFKDIDLVSFATNKDIVDNPINNLLYLPKIANLAVNQKCRRQGIASLLVNQLLDTADLWGFPMVTLSVEVDNNKAKTFYDKMGFEQVHIDNTGKVWDVSGLRLRQVAGPKCVMKRKIGI